MFRTKEMRPDQIMIAPERVVKASYTKEENYRAYKLFSMMDIDGGGSISLRELNRVMMGDMQRYVTCDFSHPDTGIIFGVDEEQCVMIASIEAESMASKYPFLIPRMRLHRVNANFYVKPYDARSLQAVYQQLLRLHDEPVALEFYEPIIVINKFSCMLDVEVNHQIFSVTLPVGAVYNHHIFCEKILDLMRQTSPMLQFLELKFIPNRRQVIFYSDVAEFRLLFATGPNFRRSCRYALGFSAEDLPYSNEHQGQPMLMDLRLGISSDQMEVLMKELFTLYDEDGSGEFEFEEFRDFYIQYLDTEESLDRLRYYAQFRFRDIERENYVKKLQLERTNKLQRREVLRVKYAHVIEDQKKKLLEDSYIDKYGLRRRNYRHRTNDRLNYERLQSISTGAISPADRREELKFGFDQARMKMKSDKDNISHFQTLEEDADHHSHYGEFDTSPVKPSTQTMEQIDNSDLHFQLEPVSIKSKHSDLTIDEASIKVLPKSLSGSNRAAVISSTKNESVLSVPMTRDELQHEKRKLKKEKQFQQYLRRQKILSKIMEANKALRKFEKAKARKQELSQLSTQLMELHYLVKQGIINSIKIENVEEFDMMKAFSLNIHGIVASPGINFTSAFLGQHLEPSSLDVENLPSWKMHPAGSYYYFLRDTHYQSAMSTKRVHIVTSFSIDPTRGKNERLESLGNAEFMHPAFFTTDFVRQPTRHSNVALSYVRIMKRKLHEGIKYRMEHGIRKRYDHFPPEDFIATKDSTKHKKVRFLDVAPSNDTEHGKLIGRITIKSIKINNIPSIHIFQRNSPFVQIECGPCKFSSEVYSYGGDSCEWDDLDWIFRLYEPNYLVITARSGTVGNNALIGKCAISVSDLLSYPRDKNNNALINGVFTDPDHDSKVKVFGDFALTLFIEPGQEWQWYIRNHDTKQDHRRHVRLQMLEYSKTLNIQSNRQGLYDDVVPLPFTLKIMSISVFDLKSPSGSLFGNSWLSKSSLFSTYLVLDTGNHERSTVDYKCPANKHLDETSIDWEHLFWDIIIESYEMNLIFKVFTKSGSVGRFVLNGSEVVSKLSKGMFEVEYYGDIKNYPSTEEITGKIHIRCQVVNDFGKLKSKRATLRDPRLETEQNQDFGTVVSSNNYQSSSLIKNSQSNQGGSIPGDLVFLRLPLMWEVSSLEIRLTENTSAVMLSFFKFNLLGKSSDELKESIKISLSIDNWTDLKVASPIVKSAHDLGLPISSLQDISGEITSSHYDALRVEGSAGSFALVFENLGWSLPLRENMKLTLRLLINGNQSGILHIHSNEFYAFKKNILLNDSVLIYRFLNNGKEICGSVKIRGKVRCEQDAFFIDRTIKLMDKDYLASRQLLTSEVQNKNIETIDSDTHLLAGLLDRVQVVPGIVKTDYAVKSHRTGMIMIDREEIPAGFSSPVLLLNHNSSDPKDVAFPVVISITEVMVTDLKSVHLLKKNAPQVTFACGINAFSTKQLLGNGCDGIWTGLDCKLNFESFNQNLRVHVKSFSTSIGECSLSAGELMEVRPDNTGMREAFMHIVLHSDQVLKGEKSNFPKAGAISRGKIKLSYFLHSHVIHVPLVPAVNKSVMELSTNRFIEFPICVTLYDVTLLNLKSVHFFNKNSPLVKVVKLSNGFSEELFETSVLSAAGSYAKWMKLMWPFVLDDDGCVVELKVLSESIVIGKALINANKFLSTIPDRMGLCELEFPLTSGNTSEFPSGTLRFSYTYEPHVDDQDLLEELKTIDVQIPPNLNGGSDTPSLVVGSSVMEEFDSSKAKRNALTADEQGLTLLRGPNSKNLRSVLLVAMSVIFRVDGRSNNTTKFMVNSLLKHNVIRVHIICGSFFSSAELIETTNEYILSNINLLEKFAIDFYTPLKLRIYDPRGKQMGESVYDWDDFTRNKYPLDHHGYCIMEQDLIRIDEDYHEILGTLRIKVKVSKANVRVDGSNWNQEKNEIVKHLYKVAPIVDIPFHLKIKTITVYDLLIDSEMIKSCESLNSQKYLTLRLQYEQLQWSILGNASFEREVNPSSNERSWKPDFQNIEFCDDSLLFTITNEFESWRFNFSLFPFQNVSIGEVSILVSDWQEALVRKSVDDESTDAREIFANITRRDTDGHEVIVGRVCIYFQAQEILFRTSFNSMLSSINPLKEENNNDGSSQPQEPVGYLRVKSIAVSQLKQVYALFKNSPKVTLIVGTDFEAITDVAWEAGAEYIWENLQWGKINICEGMSIQLKVSSANEIIGTCIIGYKELIRKVSTKSSSKAMTIITADLEDGRFKKGKIEMAFYFNMKSSQAEELNDHSGEKDSSLLNSTTLDSIIEETNNQGEFSEDSESGQMNRKGEAAAVPNSGGRHFTAKLTQLSDNTPSPVTSELIFLSISLFDLANPPNTVYRNSPQVFFSCGDWRSWTDPALFAGKNANWLFQRSKKWKLLVKGSPYVKVAVMTNNYLLGIACFSIREMGAVGIDKLGISNITRELYSTEGKYCGVVEIRFVFNIIEEAVYAALQRSSYQEQVASLKVNTNSRDGTVSQVSPLHTIVKTDVLPYEDVVAPANVEWPINLRIFQIQVQDIPNQHWFVDNSLSLRLKTMTDHKIASVQSNSRSFAMWNDLNWDIRVHSKDDYLGIILFSSNKVIGTLKFSIKDILSQRQKNSSGYVEISKKLQIKTNASCNTTIEASYGRVTISLQVANIPSKQKKEKLLEFCNKYFAEVSNEKNIIALIQPRLVSVVGISKMYHDCFITLVAGINRNETVDMVNNSEFEKSTMMKNWNGNMIFNVEHWGPIKIHDRLFVVLYLESKTGELIGSLSLSAFQMVTAPVDVESRLAVVYGDLMIGLSSHGKFSMTFERLDLNCSTISQPPILMDEVGDIERPHVWTINQGKVVNIIQVNSFNLTSIHKSGRNSPLLIAEYRGLKYMTDSIPFGGSSGEWRDMNWPIECRDTGILKLRVNSCSVEIGTATIAIKDLYELPLNEFGECEIEKPLLKGKQLQGMIKVVFYLVESKLVKLKLNAIDSMVVKGESSSSQELKTVTTHISEIEEAHNRILVDNIDQFKQLFAQKRTFKSSQHAADEAGTISSFSHYDDATSFENMTLSPAEENYGVDESISISAVSRYNSVPFDESTVASVTSHQSVDGYQSSPYSNECFDVGRKGLYRPKTSRGDSPGLQVCASTGGTVASTDANSVRVSECHQYGDVSKVPNNHNKNSCDVINPHDAYKDSNTSLPYTSHNSLNNVSGWSSDHSDLGDSIYQSRTQVSSASYHSNAGIESIFSYRDYPSSRPSTALSDNSSLYDSSYPSTSRTDYSSFSDESEYSRFTQDFPYEPPDEDFRITSRPLTSFESSKDVSKSHETLQNPNDAIEKIMKSSKAITHFPSTSETLLGRNMDLVSSVSPVRYVFDLSGLVWIPFSVLDSTNVPVPMMSADKIAFIIAETFTYNIIETVLSSFVAMSVGQDFDAQAFNRKRVLGNNSNPMHLSSSSRYSNVQLMVSLAVVRNAIQLGATRAMAVVLANKEENAAYEKKQETMRYLKRGGILMKRLDSTDYNLMGQGILASYKDNEDDFHIPLEKYYKKGSEAKFIPIKARFTIEDIIGIDLGVIDLRVMPTRPYLTACRPGGNWAAETNPLRIDLTLQSFSKEKDLILNYYNLHTKFRWEPFIMRRGQVVQMDLHDAGSGLIIGKCILPYEDILDTFPEKQHEFDLTVYGHFQIANEFGGGHIGGVIRVHVDLTVNLFSRSKKNEAYWSEHRSQHWKHFPLTPICFGVVRQQYKEIAEEYDQQRVIHPAFYGFKIRMRGNIEDESKFIHPLFQGFFLCKKVFDSKVMSGKDTINSSALKSTAGNPFRWDPTAHERNQCPVCVNGLVGCPRCFMMPIRVHDGLYFAPGEFGYDPDEERAKKLLQEQRMIKIATKKARKLAAIKWMADIPQLPPTRTERLLEGAETHMKEASSDDSSAASQSVYSQLTDQIEREYEEEVSQVILSTDKAKIEKPDFHTNLTTYKSLRLYRIKVLCQMNIFIKVLPAGYIRRITCESKETIFQLYMRFNSHSQWGTVYNSRILLPTSTGLFELFPNLAVESDLMMADNRGHDRLEEFHLNENNGVYVLLFFKNYHAANVSGTLQGYFNKNTEHIIQRIPIYNGVDKLPAGKVSQDPVQITLRNMVLTEYELQQQEVVKEFIALGKAFKSSKEAQMQIEAAREKLKAKFIEDEKNAMKLRLMSQVKQLNDLTPRSKKKAVEKLMKRENEKKKVQLIKSSKDEESSALHPSKMHSRILKSDDDLSVSDVVLNEIEDAEDDEGYSIEQLESIMGEHSDTGNRTENFQSEPSDAISISSRSQASISDIDVGEGLAQSIVEVEEPIFVHNVVGSTVGAIAALRQVKSLPNHQGLTIDILNATDGTSFADQERLEELFSKSVNSGSIEDHSYYSGSVNTDDDEDEIDENDDSPSQYSEYYTSSDASRRTSISHTNTQWSDFSNSQDTNLSDFSGSNTSRSTYSDYGSESIFSVDDRNTDLSHRTSAESKSIKSSSSSFYSTESFFTTVEFGSSSNASTTGSSLIPLDHIATQSYHLSKSDIHLNSKRASGDNNQPSLKGDVDSVGIYSHQYSETDLGDSVTSRSSRTQSSEGLSYQSEGLFTYRSNISTSTNASDISLLPSSQQFSYLSAESISRYASAMTMSQDFELKDSGSIYSKNSLNDSRGGSSRSEISFPSSRSSSANSLATSSSEDSFASKLMISGSTEKQAPGNIMPISRQLSEFSTTSISKQGSQYKGYGYISDGSIQLPTHKQRSRSSTSINAMQEDDLSYTSNTDNFGSDTSSRPSSQYSYASTHFSDWSDSSYSSRYSRSARTQSAGDYDSSDVSGSFSSRSSYSTDLSMSSSGNRTGNDDSSDFSPMDSEYDVSSRLKK